MASPNVQLCPTAPTEFEVNPKLSVAQPLLKLNDAFGRGQTVTVLNVESLQPLEFIETSFTL